MSATTSARAAAVLFVVVALFQVLVALGAPWGAFTQGGGTEGTLPAVGRGVAVVSAVIVLVMAGSILARAGLGPLRRLPRVVITALAWLTTIYSALAVLANLATPSMRERVVWAPVSIALFLLVSWTMLRTRGASRPSSALSDD